MHWPWGEKGKDEGHIVIICAAGVVTQVYMTALFSGLCQFYEIYLQVDILTAAHLVQHMIIAMAVGRWETIAMRQKLQGHTEVNGLSTIVVSVNLMNG